MAEEKKKTCQQENNNNKLIKMEGVSILLHNIYLNIVKTNTGVLKRFEPNQI